MIYLDHSATTPTDPRVVEAMLPYFTEVYGNASSAHQIGKCAQQAIESARTTVARILNCRPREIVFTSGGSESDNLAVRGAAWGSRTRGKHLITSPIEHGAIGKTVEQLAAQQGFERSLLPVDRYGQVSPDAFEQLCGPDTAFASVMYANNEIGSIQPIAALAGIARQRRIVFHTDAVQAAGQLPLDAQALGVDLLSLSGHKFYGPKGVGVLYIREGTPFSSSQTGGGQEGGYRAGTHCTPLIVGFAKALQLAYEEFEVRNAHFQTMRNYLIERVLSTVPGTVLSGHPTERLSTHASFILDGIPSSALVDALDSDGIAASGASACKAGSPEPSGVVLALGYTRSQAASTLRLTVGLKTTFQEIDAAVQSLACWTERLRPKQVIGRSDRIVALR